MALSYRLLYVVRSWYNSVRFSQITRNDECNLGFLNKQNMILFWTQGEFRFAFCRWISGLSILLTSHTFPITNKVCKYFDMKHNLVFLFFQITEWISFHLIYILYPWWFNVLSDLAVGAVKYANFPSVAARLILPSEILYWLAGVSVSVMDGIIRLNWYQCCPCADCHAHRFAILNVDNLSNHFNKLQLTKLTVFLASFWSSHTMVLHCSATSNVVIEVCWKWCFVYVSICEYV